MTPEERTFILEAKESLVDCYRELANDIANDRIARGFLLCDSEPESAYTSQIAVAWLGYLVLDKVIPALIAVHEASRLVPSIGKIIDKVLEKQDTDLDCAGMPEFISSLQGAVSKAATANGLPGCHYYRNATPDEIKRACDDDQEAA